MAGRREQANKEVAMIPVTTQCCAGCQSIEITSQMREVPGEGYFCADCLLKREDGPRLAFYRWLYLTARRLTEWPCQEVELRGDEELPTETLVARQR